MIEVHEKMPKMMLLQVAKDEHAHARDYYTRAEIVRSILANRARTSPHGGS